jgi:hypothetical protein
MVQTSSGAGGRKSRKKRFTVSLDAADYERLRALAAEHRPPLSLQYVVNYAIQEFLARADEAPLDVDLGDPLKGERDGGES